MLRPGQRRIALVIAALTLIGAPHAAFAHESGGSQLAKDPPAVTDEGARAKAIASEIEASAKTRPADVESALRRTREALARAHGAHGAGDARTARMLGKVALGWAEAAKAQQAATRAERAGAEAEKAAADLATRRDRGRALITEAQARKGQLVTQIERKKADIEAAKAPKDKAKPGDKKPADKKPAADAPKSDKAAKKPDGDKAPSKKPEKKSPKKGAQP